MSRQGLFAFTLLAVSAFTAAASAQDYVITLKDHTFTPKELVIPARQKITLTVINEQTTPAEFESSQLGREKVVGANSQITVIIGPLQPGQYTFEDDFHDESTGVITAK